MRTTIEIDDALLARAQAQFPPGTPKTVLVEEGLRRLVAPPAIASARHRDPRVQRLIDEGHLAPATTGGPRDPRVGCMTLAQIITDLAGDREDR